MAETCDDVCQLAKRLDLAIDQVVNPAQAETIATILDATFDLLKHVEAIASIPGAAWSQDELAVLRTMRAELGDGHVDLDDYRRAIAVLMRP